MENKISILNKVFFCLSNIFLIQRGSVRWKLRKTEKKMEGRERDIKIFRREREREM
jgi:hypothetical protein